MGLVLKHLAWSEALEGPYVILSHLSGSVSVGALDICSYRSYRYIGLLTGQFFLAPQGPRLAPGRVP